MSAAELLVDSTGHVGIASFSISPVLSLSPSAGMAGARAVMTGRGFAASRAVRVMFDRVLATACATDLHGTLFGCAFVIPPEVPGAHRVTAIDSRGHAVSLPLCTLRGPMGHGLSCLSASGTYMGVDAGTVVERASELAAVGKMCWSGSSSPFATSTPPGPSTRAVMTAPVTAQTPRLRSSPGSLSGPSSSTEGTGHC